VVNPVVDHAVNFWYTSTQVGDYFYIIASGEVAIHVESAVRAVHLSWADPKGRPSAF
jgi:hypothetical protein